MTDPDPLDLLLTAPREVLLDRSTPEGGAIDGDPALRAGAELVVAAETAMAAVWAAPRAPLDVTLLITRRRRRWVLRGSGMLFWGCAVPFAGMVLLLMLVGLGVMVYALWIVPMMA